jgi:hypothetical protein
VRRVVAAGLAVIAALLLVSGCRDDEQHRPLSFAKGEYAGPKAEEPSPQALTALQKRLQTQNY